MRVRFLQNCTMSVGNMTVKSFVEGQEDELDGTALASALADGRCAPIQDKPAPEETKQANPVVENKGVKKPSKKAK